jgi:hypothetical protein
MRTLVCIGILIAIAAAFFAVHDMLSRTIPSMLRLAVGSMVIALSLAAIILRLVERRDFGPFRSTAFSAVAVFLFFGTWIALWFVSEQILIDHYLRVRGGGDTGYNHFYPGASGMGYAEGLSQPDKIVSRVLRVGGFGALLLSVPFGAILTAFKRQSEQGVAPQPAARSESDFAGSLPPST